MGESVTSVSTAPRSMDRRAHAINRELVRGRVVHDAALADLFPARFELRLDQNDGLDWSPGFSRTAASTAGSTSVAEIKDTSMDTKLISEPKIARLEVAGIGALAQAHARISAQGLGDLPVAGIDRDHAGCAMLQHAIGKSTGGGANIGAVPPGKVDLPTRQARLPA